MLPLLPEEQLATSKQQRLHLSTDNATILLAWLSNPKHAAHRYPNKQEKVRLMEQTGLDKTQLNNWFKNVRRRNRKPPPESIAQIQAKVEEAKAARKVKRECKRKRDAEAKPSPTFPAVTQDGDGTLCQNCLMGGKLCLQQAHLGDDDNDDTTTTTNKKETKKERQA